MKDIANFSKGAGISKDQLSETGESCILYGELYTKYKSEVISNVISKTDIENSNLVWSKANDVIIPSSGETAIDISTARCVPYDNILLGGDLNIIRLKDQDGRFFSYQLNGVRKLEIAKRYSGNAVRHYVFLERKSFTDHIKKSEVDFQIRENIMADLGLNVIWYKGNDNHKELPELLKQFHEKRK